MAALPLKSAFTTIGFQIRSEQWARGHWWAIHMAGHARQSRFMPIAPPYPRRAHSGGAADRGRGQIALLSPHLLRELTERTRQLSTHLRHEVRIRDDLGAQDGPRVWLEIRDSKGIYAPLAYMEVVSVANRLRYVVGRPGEPGLPQSLKTEVDALRALQREAVAAGKAMDLGPSPVAHRSPASLETPAVAAPARAPQKPAEPPARPGQTFTADEAVNHPVIRAAVIAGYEIARRTRKTPDPVMVRAMANAALTMVDVMWPHYAQADDGADLIERLVVGAVSGALEVAHAAASIKDAQGDDPSPGRPND